MSVFFHINIYNKHSNIKQGSSLIQAKPYLCFPNFNIVDLAFHQVIPALFRIFPWKVIKLPGNET
jgi:hypothetical protein